MTDLMKAALGSAVIVAIGLVLAATQIKPRYTIGLSSSGAIAWSMDQKTGRFTYCAFNEGCHLVPAN